MVKWERDGGKGKQEARLGMGFTGYRVSVLVCHSLLNIGVSFLGMFDSPLEVFVVAFVFGCFLENSLSALFPFFEVFNFLMFLNF